MLKVEGLETSYGQSQVLFQLGFEVNRGEVVGLHFVIELDFLNGRERLPGYEVRALVHY